MGKIWIPGGGDGADLDVITAASSDVRKGRLLRLTSSWLGHRLLRGTGI